MGESRYKEFYDSYIFGSNGAVLVFDLTRPITLGYLDQWIPKFQKEDLPLPIVLIGTKFDLVDDITVVNEKSKKFMNQYNLSNYFKVNSKSGEYIEQAFETLINLMLKHKKKNILKSE